jgi:5-methylcytosine-specific restriction endonuclease McrA
MCAREKQMLQRGMYFREPPATSIVLMSRRPGANYVDTLSEDGTELEYEGHDARRDGAIDPKSVDQPWNNPNGTRTENGRFADAAKAYIQGKAPAKVRVYEKLRPGIWSDKGLFDLIGCDYREEGGRKVFRLRMRLTSEVTEHRLRAVADKEVHSRLIPSWVKQEVYKRDKGSCVLCGSQDHLHFDHDLPYSRGGASLTPDNVRLLCARHNLEKAAKIE